MLFVLISVSVVSDDETHRNVPLLDAFANPVIVNVKPANALVVPPVIVPVYTATPDSTAETFVKVSVVVVGAVMEVIGIAIAVFVPAAPFHTENDSPASAMNAVCGLYPIDDPAGIWTGELVLFKL
jgi:hypothetical protein